MEGGQPGAEYTATLLPRGPGADPSAPALALGQPSRRPGVVPGAIPRDVPRGFADGDRRRRRGTGPDRGGAVPAALHDLRRRVDAPRRICPFPPSGGPTAAPRPAAGDVTVWRQRWSSRIRTCHAFRGRMRRPPSDAEISRFGAPRGDTASR